MEDILYFYRVKFLYQYKNFKLKIKLNNLNVKMQK